MISFSPSDLSPVHNANEPPEMPGWYITEHCTLINLNFQQSISLQYLIDRRLLHYWDTKYWYLYPYTTDISKIMPVGVIGCADISISGLGRWVGLKQPY